MTSEEKHQISVLRGKMAHKTGKEREEALEAYWRAKRSIDGESTDYKSVALPLRHSGTSGDSNSYPMNNLCIIETNSIKSQA